MNSMTPDRCVSCPWTWASVTQIACSSCPCLLF
ncbi:protein MpCupin41 [Marchantia polymorpha subsp. ruderalis]